MGQDRVACCGPRLLLNVQARGLKRRNEWDKRTRRRDEMEGASRDIWGEGRSPRDRWPRRQTSGRGLGGLRWPRWSRSVGGLQADAAELKGSRSACDPSVGWRRGCSCSDDLGIQRQRVWKEGPGLCVFECVWKCSSQGMLAHLSVIYSMEQMKPRHFPSVNPTLLTAANLRIPEKMLEAFWS